MALPRKKQSQPKTEKSVGKKSAAVSLKIFYVSICSSNPLEFIFGKYYILKIPKINAILTKL